MTQRVSAGKKHNTFNYDGENNQCRPRKCVPYPGQATGEQATCQDDIFDTLRRTKLAFEEYGVRFWLMGGTFLGAVRENDIIPWEGDFDVWTTRRDVAALAAKNQEIRAKYNITVLNREGWYSKVCDWFAEQPIVDYDEVIAPSDPHVYSFGDLWPT